MPPSGSTAVPWSQTPVTLTPAEPTPLSHQVRISGPGTLSAAARPPRHAGRRAAHRAGDWHANQFGGPMQYNRSASLVIRVRLDPRGRRARRPRRPALRRARRRGRLASSTACAAPARAPVDFSRPPEYDEAEHRPFVSELHHRSCGSICCRSARCPTLARRSRCERGLGAAAPRRPPRRSRRRRSRDCARRLPPELADAQILELLKTAGEVRAFSRETGAPPRAAPTLTRRKRRRRWTCSTAWSCAGT